MEKVNSHIPGSRVKEQSPGPDSSNSKRAPFCQPAPWLCPADFVMKTDNVNTGKGYNYIIPLLSLLIFRAKNRPDK
jgi:hypothetical protein